jgi:hypothetical protein
MIYINADNTDEWGILEGTKESRPEDTWLPITETDRPEIGENEVAYQIKPILIEDDWVQQWAVRPMTEKEIDIRDNPEKYFPLDRNAQNLQGFIDAYNNQQ